jgi:hypothetical protein
LTLNVKPTYILLLIFSNDRFGVNYDDEWCAEAYMETDYSTLCDEDFIRKMRDYAAFLVQNEEI